MRSETRSGVVPHRKWTAEEFGALCRSGVLGEDERLELLDGELVPMTPPGEKHTAITTLLTNILVSKATPEGLLVGSQSPLACGRSRPQPDLYVFPKAQWEMERYPHSALLHTDPNAKAGRYRAIRILGTSETLTTSALPRLKLDVAVLFGARH